MTSLAKSADVALPANMAWTSDSDHTDSRSGQYSTVYARCYTVYPDSGTDTFQQIRCRVTNGYGSVIKMSGNVEIPGWCVKLRDGIMTLKGINRYRTTSSSDIPEPKLKDFVYLLNTMKIL